jgi:hypothetical protein
VSPLVEAAGGGGAGAALGGGAMEEEALPAAETATAGAALESARVGVRKALEEGKNTGKQKRQRAERLSGVGAEVRKPEKKHKDKA